MNDALPISLLILDITLIVSIQINRMKGEAVFLWPDRSPSQTVLDYYLSGSLKVTVFKIPRTKI